MEYNNDALGMLDLLTAPGFCVAEGRIIKVNPAAAALFFSEGMEILPLLESGQQEYSGFTGGCLCLSLTYLDKVWNACVTRYQSGDIFLLEDAVQPELQILALAARELRMPLNNTMLITDTLLHSVDPALTDAVSRLNRGLYQLLRIVGNMSDAGYQPSGSNHSLHEMGTVVKEIQQKLTPLAETAGFTVQYSGLTEPVYSLCDPQQLERAMMNLLSNAIKFTPKGGQIQIALTRSGNLLRLSMEDSGSGIGSELLRRIFHRYLRQPAIEDSRHGIGLGMVLIRQAALQHGGTVLIDQPEGTGSRITLTLPIRQEEVTLRERILRPVASGYDSGLIELSEVLPAAMYDGTK